MNTHKKNRTNHLTETTEWSIGKSLLRRIFSSGWSSCIPSTDALALVQIHAATTVAHTLRRDTPVCPGLSNFQAKQQDNTTGFADWPSILEEPEHDRTRSTWRISDIVTSPLLLHVIDATTSVELEALGVVQTMLFAQRNAKPGNGMQSVGQMFISVRFVTPSADPWNVWVIGQYLAPHSDRHPGPGPDLFRVGNKTEFEAPRNISRWQPRSDSQV